eukprot:SAG11_NODE_13322_length_660_cov_0.912656_1_plen_111_part_01
MIVSSSCAEDVKSSPSLETAVHMDNSTLTGRHFSGEFCDQAVCIALTGGFEWSVGSAVKYSGSVSSTSHLMSHISSFCSGRAKSSQSSETTVHMDNSTLTKSRKSLFLNRK